MAAAAVATVLGKQRRDLVWKVDRQIFDQVGHFYLYAGIDASATDHVNCRVAFGNRRDQTSAIDLYDPRWRGFVGRFASQIAALTTAISPCYNELLPRVAPRNRDQPFFEAA